MSNVFMEGIDEAIVVMKQWVASLLAYCESTFAIKEAEILKSQDTAVLNVDARATQENREATSKIAGVVDGWVSVLGKDGASAVFGVSAGTEVIGISVCGPGNTTVTVGSSTIATLGGIGSEIQGLVYTPGTLSPSYYQTYIDLRGIIDPSVLSQITVNAPQGYTCQATVSWIRETKDLTERVS